MINLLLLLLKTAARKAPGFRQWSKVSYWWSRNADGMIIQKDFEDYSRQSADILNVVPNGKETRTALFLSFAPNIYTIKQEIMLALGLRLRGWNIIFLIRPDAHWAFQFFTWCKLGRIEFWDRYISWSNFIKVRHAVKTLLNGSCSFQSVKKWTYRNAWIGPQLLASISRNKMTGAPDPSRPDEYKELARILPESILAVHTAENILAKIPVNLCIVNEPNYAFVGPVVDMAIAKGIPVIHFSQPSRDDALVLKKLTKATRRIHPNSLSLDTFTHIQKEPWNESKETELLSELKKRYDGTYFLQSRNQPKTSPVIAQEIKGKLGLNSEKKTACIFCPVLWDANLFYGEDLFDDFGHWFVETVLAAVRNPHLNWLIKLHPANKWKRAMQKTTEELADLELLRANVGVLPSHVKVLLPDCDISTWCLFETIDYGVTVRGTVGIELPCFGKPVLTGGTGRYSGLGFTIDSQTREEYLSRLDDLQNLPPLDLIETEKARQHAHAIFLRRPWIMKSFKSKFDYLEWGSHVLDHNLFPVVQSLSRVEGVEDLTRWADWAIEEQSVDFLQN